jgi:hypothetical protein
MKLIQARRRARRSAARAIELEARIVEAATRAQAAADAKRFPRRDTAAKHYDPSLEIEDYRKTRDLLRRTASSLED